MKFLRRVSSFPVMIACLLAALATLTVRARFDDPDMWWHLKVGQFIWLTHKVPTVDYFSWTTHQHSWIPHEWLSQLTIFLAYHAAGYSGLMLWLCLFSCAVLIVGYALCVAWSGNAKVSLVGALAIWLFATTGLSVRPQMIGYLLLLVELLLLQFGRKRSPRWFLALPFLFAIWINCHGSWLLGILVLCITLFASFVSYDSILLTSTRWPVQQRMMLGVSLAFSIAALFVNPTGLQQILYPIDTMLHQPLNLASVTEWQPVTLTDGRGAALVAMLLCICLLVAVRKIPLRLDELLLLALGVWLGASHERMLFVFGILAAPIFTRLLAGEWEDYDPEHDLNFANAVISIGALLTMWLAFPSPTNLAVQVAANSPVKAVDFLKSHAISGHMLNDYTYGGYLIWAAPEHPVFIDGRADLYEWAGVLADFAKWANLQEAPNVLPEKYGVDFCLLSRGSTMAAVMPLLPDWKTIYSDDNTVIMQHTYSAAK